MAGVKSRFEDSQSRAALIYVGYLQLKLLIIRAYTTTHERKSTARETIHEAFIPDGVKYEFILPNRCMAEFNVSLCCLLYGLLGKPRIAVLAHRYTLVQIQ